jgi:hypothetical protein
MTMERILKIEKKRPSISELRREAALEEFVR